MLRTPVSYVKKRKVCEIISNSRKNIADISFRCKTHNLTKSYTIMNDKKEITKIQSGADIVKSGSIHTKYDLTIQMHEDNLYIEVMNVIINSDADQVPYWKWMRIYPNELESIVKAKKTHADSAQLYLERCNSGVLMIGFYIE